MFSSFRIAQNSGILSYCPTFDAFRPYFEVDNKYILKKFIQIIMPFIGKEWKKKGGDEQYMSSTQEYDKFRAEQDEIDQYQVDLYLPIMSLVTLILMIGF